MEMALTHAQQIGLEAAVLAYLAAAEGGRFARAAAAFKEELQRGGSGDGKDNLVVSGAVLEKAWMCVHRSLDDDATKAKKVFDAIEAGDLAEVELYVCVGVDVEALRYGEDAWPPLLQAASCNRLELVQLFVNMGHDKDAQNQRGSSPLIMAVQQGHFPVVQYLVEQCADKDKANINGYLVEQGADKDKANNDGTTPLMLACLFGHVDVAEYLLDQGCDRDRADNNGWTALHAAAQGGHLVVAQVLFRWGVKLDARNNAGETPADVATRHGHPHIADAIRAEEIRRRDHGFKRDRSTIEGTEEHEAAKRPRVEEAVVAEEESEGDDDDDDDDDDEEEGEA